MSDSDWIPPTTDTSFDSECSEDDHLDPEAPSGSCERLIGTADDTSDSMLVIVSVDQLILLAAAEPIPQCTICQAVVTVTCKCITSVIHLKWVGTAEVEIE